MSHRKPLVAIAVASVAFGSFVFAGRVLAATPTTCTSDAECSKGFTCQPWAVSTGTAPACPAGAPDCAVTNTPGVETGGPGGGSGSSVSSGGGGAIGTDLGAGAGNASGTTPTTTVISRCEPGPCQVDSDCGPDMVCHTESYSECSGAGSTAPPCEPNTKCDSKPVINEATCTTKTSSFCAFHWQLPCTAAADCGAGFTCQPLTITSCSGGTPVSGGTGPGVGGTTGTSSSDPTSPPDNCTTTTTFPGTCQPVATICNVDADCPANWVCQDTVTPPSRGEASGVGGNSGSGDGASGTGTGAGAVSGSNMEPGGTTASSRMCSSPFIPPAASDNGAGGRAGGEGASEPTSGSTPPGSSGTGGTTGGPGKDTPGAGAANGAAQVADASGASNGAGGCSVGGSGAAGSRVAGGLSMLALLGLGVVARRRRR